MQKIKRFYKRISSVMKKYTFFYAEDRRFMNIHRLTSFKFCRILVRLCGNSHNISNFLTCEILKYLKKMLWGPLEPQSIEC